MTLYNAKIQAHILLVPISKASVATPARLFMFSFLAFARSVSQNTRTMAALLPPQGHGAVRQPWFAGAPLTRVIACGTALLYALFETNHVHPDLSLDYDRLIADGELYRLFTCSRAI